MRQAKPMGYSTRQQGRPKISMGQAKETASDAAQVVRQGAIDAENYVALSSKNVHTPRLS
jgi:hypothetical protein